MSYREVLFRTLKYTLLLTSAIISSCNRNIKFNKQEWVANPDVYYYPYRNSMYVDLVKNHRLIGLNYSQLIDSIGIPLANMTISDTNSTIIDYPIAVDFDVIDPDYSKDLVIRLNKDSIVDSVRVTEWKKGKDEKTLIHRP